MMLLFFVLCLITNALAPPISYWCFSTPTPPLLVFSKCGKSCPNSNSLNQTWKVSFFFQSLFVDEFFYYPCCFWEIMVNNVFVCCCHNYLDIVHSNYTRCISFLHIAFHLHNCIVYFFNTLHHKVDFWINNIILFWQKTYLFLISPLG